MRSLRLGRNDGTKRKAAAQRDTPEERPAVFKRKSHEAFNS